MDEDMLDEEEKKRLKQEEFDAEWKLQRRRLVVGFPENYTANPTEREDIHDEDVVRAINGIYYTVNEVVRFAHKNRNRAPTYGNCRECFMSGPVGVYCDNCNSPTCGYVIMFTSPFNSTKILDAENLSRILGSGHLVAKADGWTIITQKMEPFNRRKFCEIANKMNMSAEEKRSHMNDFY